MLLKAQGRGEVNWTLKGEQVLPAGERHLRQKEHRGEGGVFRDSRRWGRGHVGCNYSRAAGSPVDWEPLSRLGPGLGALPRRPVVGHV